MTEEKLDYQQGFANHFQTEAIAGSLPQGQNSPQKVPFGLYAEQLSGTAFTAPRAMNKRSWFYRIRPSVCQPALQPLQHRHLHRAVFAELAATPNALRWSPQPLAVEKQDFLQSLLPWCGHGDANSMGGAVYLYNCTLSMQQSAFYNADGELLIVPEQGALLLMTEFGKMAVATGEIAVIPRGVKFAVHLQEGAARGYVLENYGSPLTLPDLGPIGANGLANSRDFLTPVACFEDRSQEYCLVSKFQGELWQTTLQHSPFDVVAWHGNYVPYKYDLNLFNTINTVSYDHPDPSIFTVLTSPGPVAGTANIDFVIFPARWMVAEHTFRPPYYHRNLMSEFMGLIQGQYDAKDGGFAPGGASLHNTFTPHGPDAAAFAKAQAADLQPEYYHGTLAFMFESRLAWQPSVLAMNSPSLQSDYQQCWAGLAASPDLSSQ